MPVTIERAVSSFEASARLFGFILPMAREVAQAPVDDEKAFIAACSVIEQGHTFVAWDEGEIIGSLGLVKVAYWYGDGESSFLLDRWLYVRPDRRFGSVGVKLLRAGREEGKLLNLNTFVVVANPDRTPKQNEASIYSVIAGYSPFTHLMHLHKVPVAEAAEG
tara:strand:+ start:1272 stop:1760 length:489 start_codon:yes stop_codon:yes gene_type:complete